MQPQAAGDGGHIFYHPLNGVHPSPRSAEVRVCGQQELAWIAF